MKKNHPPYIGFGGLSEKLHAEKIMRSIGPLPDSHLAAFGFDADLDRLPASLPRYPHQRPFFKRFCEDPLARNIVRCAASGRTGLFERLCQLAALSEASQHGIQLPAALADAAALFRYRERFPDAIVSVRLGRDCFNAAGNSAARFADKVRHAIDPVADYLLLDPHDGRDTALSADAVAPYLRALRDAGVEATVILAGRLSGASAGALLQRFPECGVETECGALGQEAVLAAARSYFAGALAGLGYGVPA